MLTVAPAASGTIADVDLALVLIVLIVMALIWRGPKTLPQIGAMLGRGMRQARREVDGAKTDQVDPDERA